MYTRVCNTVLLFEIRKNFCNVHTGRMGSIESYYREQGLVSELRILPLCQGGSKGIDNLVLLFDCRTKKEVIRPHPLNVPFPCTDVNFGLKLKES